MAIRTLRVVLMLLMTLLSIMPSENFAAELAAPQDKCSEASGKSYSFSSSTLAEQLGWVLDPTTRCGGYYLEGPFTYSSELLKGNTIKIRSNELLFSQHGTSIGKGKVTITRFGQQIIANKAYLYRDPQTGKLSAIDLMSHVILREPDSLIIAKWGHFDIKKKSPSLHAILYRTAIYSRSRPKSAALLSNKRLQKNRKVYQLSAWGQAQEFNQEEPKVYNFEQVTYSTCPPVSRVWQLNANSIQLNKNTGRGVAKNASLLVKGIPVFYTPYLNFPIDSRRQTGFLNPTLGTSRKWGAYLSTPFYWNLAPNYDTTIIPSFFSKRGIQLGNSFRYLTPSNSGLVNAAILPHDDAFRDFQLTQENKNQSSTDPYVQANLKRLAQASDTRKSLVWQNTSHFNDHWSGSVDYNYVSDDYYLRDLGGGVNTVTQNQLLQQAEISYKNPYWNFLSRIQSYQTLHPVDEPTFQNQYSRFPQLVLEGDYPSESTGLDYFIANDFSHFDIRNTPGDSTKLPMGNRLNIQPGIRFPFYRPSFYVTPRLQLAMTRYEIGRVTNGNSSNPSRTLPIFDIHAGLNFDRPVAFLGSDLRQTLEPQIYYTYVPYKDQSQLPIFDTTVNTLTYDQLFTFNRFSGLDRIGDANQLSVGVTTRFIDQQSGLEKIRAGIGQILYFKNRQVTLCTDPTTCSDNPTNKDNRRNRSPISGVLNYNLTTYWSASANTIWDPLNYKFSNQTFTLQYQRDSRRVINVSYSFVRDSTQLPGEPNLSQTDVSIAWPLVQDWSSVIHWTENWGPDHLQNILYGLQYDSCCWAVRFVAGRVATNVNLNKTYQYNPQFFIQFSLKGLGNIGSADPSSLLNTTITGYQDNFGQDF